MGAACAAETKMATMTELRPGDRIQLSRLGELRNRRKKVKVGTVLAQKYHKSGSGSVLILFDGMKEPCRLHRSYVERLKNPPAERGH